jgi:hypothetical protein
MSPTRDTTSYATKQGLDRRRQQGEIFSNQKTILDHIQQHNYTKPRRRNSVIPQGGSILATKPPQFKTYQTICDNGGRRIPSYYLGGRRVNALGFGLSTHDIKQIRKNGCHGCDGFRCASKYFASSSTAQPIHKKPAPSCPTHKPFPRPSPYFVAPYPASWKPSLVDLPNGKVGQVCEEYTFDADMD